VAAIWLNAASGRVPVWSGMALASLSNVAEFAGTGLVITPKSGVKSKIALGKVMGSVAVVTTSKLYSITMRTTVPHYVMQEETYVGASPSAPWQSFPAGIAAVANLKIDIDPPVFKSKRFKFQ